MTFLVDYELYNPPIVYNTKAYPDADEAWLREACGFVQLWIQQFNVFIGTGSLVDWLEEQYGLPLDHNLRIFWASSSYSQFQFENWTILIDDVIAGLDSVLTEHIRHELTEAFVYNYLGEYPEGHQPQYLNGRKIVSIVPSWNIGYVGAEGSAK